MKYLFTLWNKIEKTLSNLKFAVIIISVFTLFMIVGTFAESYYGTDFANRLIYKAPPFMLVQVLMFLSILFAAVNRLPPQKRLYGFYTIHAGLLTLFIGAFITYYSGVDGNLTLYPNEPAREVSLSESMLTISYENEQKEVTYPLPYTPFPRDIGVKWDNITLGTYLPFSSNEKIWLNANEAHPLQHSSEYLIANNQVSQKFTLSLFSEADFPSTQSLGPLTIHYLPHPLFSCFEKTDSSRLILWDTKSRECFTPTMKKLTLKKASSGNRYLTLKVENRTLTFFPDISPFPFNEKKEVQHDSPFRVFSQNLFENKPHLFLFGKGAAFYDKNKGEWQSLTLETNKQGQELPWMGFTLSLLKHEKMAYPLLKPQYTTPIQQDGQLIQGAQKALQIELYGKKYWVKSTEPLALKVGGERLTFTIGPKVLKLPYQLTLNRFKMDTDPGTRNPASYESFVTLFTGEDNSSHHIYMNNPLKYSNFTFYQASYFEVQPEQYGSVLSVNFDPGRPVKYLGSLLLVLGVLWHYFILKKDKKKKMHAKRNHHLNAMDMGVEPTYETT